jgi:hypothetical protein
MQDSHGSEHVKYRLMGCDTMYSGRKLPTFWKTVLPQCSQKEQTKCGVLPHGGVATPHRAITDSAADVGFNNLTAASRTKQSGLIGRRGRSASRSTLPSSERMKQLIKIEEMEGLEQGGPEQTK